MSYDCKGNYDKEYNIVAKCHNLFLGYFSSSLLFLPKQKQKNKIKTSDAEKEGREGSQTYRKIKL
jgi:hypothetical protein